MKKLFFLAAVALMIATSCNNQNNKTAQVTPEPRLGDLGLPLQPILGTRAWHQ